MRSAMALAALLVVGCLAGRSEGFDRYEVVDLGTFGGADSTALGINESGQVVGWAYTDKDVAHAYVYSNGVMRDVGPSGDTVSLATDINESGQVVGVTYDADGGHHAFLYENGVMTGLGALGGSQSHAFGINDGGQIVGWAETAGRLQHAFLYENGAMTDLGTLNHNGGSQSSAFGINASGQIVGTSKDYFFSNFTYAYHYDEGGMSKLGLSYYSAANDINRRGQIVGRVNHDAFLYSNGSITYLGTLPGGTLATATGINDLGQIVGAAATDNHGGYAAFLYADGNMVNLNTLLVPGSGMTLTSASAINDRGQIVGEGISPSGHMHAFLLTPTPEPGACWLLGVAGLGVVGRGRSRRGGGAAA